MKMPRSLLCLCFLLGGCKPFLIFPGGALEGSVTPVPADWRALDTVKTIQFETRPSDPYSVNIWVIGMGEYLYVHAGANRAAWVEHMEADDAVRLGHEGAIYELRGQRVTDQAVFDQFSDAYERKYGRRPRNENVGEAYVFRLEGRD